MAPNPARTIHCDYRGIRFEVDPEGVAHLHLPDGTVQTIASTPEQIAMFTALEVINALLDGAAETPRVP